jgi:RNA polymerase sigma-70 factor (ECF subfamily)
MKQLQTEDELRAQIAELMPALYRFSCSFTRRDADREDLVQETAMRAISSLHQFQPGTRLKSWLFTIMRNTFYNQLYAENKQLKIMQKGSVVWEKAAPMSQEWMLRLQDAQIAIADLPTDFRHALMAGLSGESYEEIALDLNCAVGTVKSRISRARQRLVRATGEDLQ